MAQQGKKKVSGEGKARKKSAKILRDLDVTRVAGGIKGGAAKKQ